MLVLDAFGPADHFSDADEVQDKFFSFNVGIAVIEVNCTGQSLTSLERWLTQPNVDWGYRF